MNDGKEQARKRPDSVAERRADNAVPDIAATTCPACQHGNPASAAFCEECGQSLTAPSSCPNWQSITHPGADICESCGTWLLRGACTSCYAPVAQNESFCAQCGNPAQGINCSHCGQLSIFDFCKRCGRALTEQAQQTAAEAASNSDLQALAALASALTSLDIDTGDVAAAEAPVDSGDALRQAARRAG